MPWLSTDDGRHFNTDWFDEDEKKKQSQINANKAEGGSKNLEEKYKYINPNYKKGASTLDSEGYNNNCAKCALAFEANMRGADVEAQPFKFGYLGERDKSVRIDKAFNNADTWNVGRNKRELVVNEIELTLQEDWGKGSRGIIQIQSGNIKHTMNVINQNGKVIVVDAQEGKHGTVAKMLKDLPTKNVNLFRTDNLQIKDEYKDWAYRRRN